VETTGPGDGRRGLLGEDAGVGLKEGGENGFFHLLRFESCVYYDDNSIKSSDFRVTCWKQAGTSERHD
jgi:hypothetical protein